MQYGRLSLAMLGFLLFWKAAPLPSFISGLQDVITAIVELILFVSLMKLDNKYNVLSFLLSPNPSSSMKQFPIALKDCCVPSSGT